MADARDPWWVIGSVAVALHGADPGEIGDIDVLASERDARTALKGQDAPLAAPSTRFRSVVIGRLSLQCGWCVEVMGDLALIDADPPERVEPSTRQAVGIGGSVLYVPDRTEMIAILRRFGRPKDLERVSALADQPSR